MANPFFWYDVMTTDVPAAQKFYCDVVGWTAEDMSGSGQPYVVFHAAGRGVAGLMPIPHDAAGMPPAWMGYILVEDLDAKIEALKAAGGVLHKGPITIDGVIRFAVVSDPQGAGFLIATPLTSEPPPPLAAGTPGTIGWRELYAADWAAVWPFYEKLFGWTKDRAIDMGAMGTYQLFRTGDDAAAGGMMTRPPQVPVSHWGYYIRVSAIDAAAARVTAGGGRILNGPMEVPGGDWVVNAIDPQGAMFSLVAPGR
jgi:predicted enzyme related to lactoylglutathione lyase